MRLVGIESNNCIEWLLVNLVCCMYGMTSVPLYDSLSQENHNYIINHSGITVLFCSAIVCNSFLKIGKFGKVKTVVLFG
jgi:long-chain acyl-CoA synthetase